MAGARSATSCIRTLSTGPAKPLYGTVPAHSSYVFLHADKPPSEFPSRLMSPIHRELQLRTLKKGTLVNYAWTGKPSELTQGNTSATVFSRRGGRLELPHVSPKNMDEVDAIIEEHIKRDSITPETGEQVHLYICTHGARDCRCGEYGGQVARSLREEVERRNLKEKVKIREVGHVGGHQYAANLLVYPHGEWLGQLRPDDIPRILDLILTRPVKPLTDEDPPIVPDHWRGRMGSYNP